MVEVFTKDRIKLAILENAIIDNVEKSLNAIGFLDFSLPNNDPKNQYCEFNNKIKLNNVVYRIIGKDDITNPNIISYHCEHILAELIDKVMFGTVIIGNLGTYTRDVINYILNDTNFVLDRCDFERQFEYKWEQENKLKALFDVPNRFVETYKFECDTSTFPYRISLIKLDEASTPAHIIAKGKNILELVKQSKIENICTKLYCLGAGEGINQINIKGVNNGLPYLMAKKENIEKYGVVEKVVIDHRFTNAQSLLEYGQKLINELQEPYIEYAVDYAQINVMGKSLDVGDTIEIVDGNSRIKRIVTKIIAEGNSDNIATVNIANKPQDIASSISDLSDRQRITEAYSQGATQLYAQSLQGNADENNGLILDFFIPEQATIINSVKLKTRMSQFRAFSKATAGGGGSTQTSSSGGGSTQTSSSGGGTATTTGSGGGVATSTENGGGTDKTTAGGGGATKTSGAASNTTTTASLSGKYGYDTSDTGLPGSYVSTSVAEKHSHKYYGLEEGTGGGGTKVFGTHHHGLSLTLNHTHSLAHTHDVNIPSHSHEFSVPNHVHHFSVPNHSHSFSVPNHTHNLTIPNHTHNLTIPNHTHEITPGIYFFGRANYFDLIVNNTKVATINGYDYETDITNYLIDESGKIPRGRWLSIEVRPNDLAYINISLAFQGYIQSTGNKTV